MAGSPAPVGFPAVEPRRCPARATERLFPPGNLPSPRHPAAGFSPESPLTRPRPPSAATRWSRSSGRRASARWAGTGTQRAPPRQTGQRERATGPPAPGPVSRPRTALVRPAKSAGAMQPGGALPRRCRSTPDQVEVLAPQRTAIVTPEPFDFHQIRINETITRRRRILHGAWSDHAETSDPHKGGYRSLASSRQRSGTFDRQWLPDRRRPIGKRGIPRDHPPGNPTPIPRSGGTRRPAPPVRTALHRNPAAARRYQAAVRPPLLGRRPVAQCATPPTPDSPAAFSTR